MKSKDIVFLAPKGQDITEQDIYLTTIIQRDFTQCDNYSIGYNDSMFSSLKSEILHSDSIYGFDLDVSNVGRPYIPNKLLDEVCIYGKKLMNICKQYIPKMKPLDFFSLNEKQSLKNLINAVDSSKILKIIIKWCKNNAFPIAPIEHTITNNIHELQFKYYELDYDTIKELTMQFIIIYLTQNFFYSTKYLIDLDYKKYEKLSQNKLDKCIDNFNFLNTYGSLCRIVDYEFDGKIFSKDTMSKKIQIIDEILLNMVAFLNNYSDIFNHTSEKYFSYDDNDYRIYHQQIYNNVFDVCWDLIAENYNQCFQLTKRCQTCKKRIPNNKKYCEEHAKENKSKSPSKSQKNKKDLMQKLIDDYESFPHIYSNNIYESIKTFKILLSKGHSKELEKYSKKKVDNIEEDMIKQYNGGII